MAKQMCITKIVACKVRPDREFIFADEKPGRIAVRSVGGQQRFWFDRRRIATTIDGLETDLAFWREMLEALEEI